MTCPPGLSWTTVSSVQGGGAWRIYIYTYLYIYIDFTTALCKSKFSKYTCVCVYFSVINDYKTPAERLDDKLNQIEITRLALSA